MPHSVFDELQGLIFRPPPRNKQSKITRKHTRRWNTKNISNLLLEQYRGIFAEIYIRLLLINSLPRSSAVILNYKFKLSCFFNRGSPEKKGIICKQEMCESRHIRRMQSHGLTILTLSLGGWMESSISSLIVCPLFPYLFLSHSQKSQCCSWYSSQKSLEREEAIPLV